MSTFPLLFTQLQHATLVPADIHIYRNLFLKSLPRPFVDVKYTVESESALYTAVQNDPDLPALDRKVLSYYTTLTSTFHTAPSIYPTNVTRHVINRKLDVESESTL